MQIKQNELSPCEVELEIEVEAEKVNKAVDQTYTELGKVVSVPGFRKGKAPRTILERYLDEDKVKDRASDIILQDAYSEALKETKLDPFAPADVDVVKFEFGEPLVFKATVPLTPQVELGTYTGLEVERTVQPVEDAQVDAEIQRMLERYTQYNQITDRPAQEGDVVVVELKDESNPDDEPKRNVTAIGENIPDFDKGLTGMQVDEEKVIEVTYPEDFESEELRGKTMPLRTKVIEINEKKIPEVTDEWVKKTFVGEQEEGAEPSPDAVDTADKLKAKIREAMDKASQDVADAEVRNKLVTQVVDNSKVCFPGIMAKSEVRDRFEDLFEELKKRKVELDDYLKHVGMTFEELSAKYEEDARKALATSLVLHEITEKENIKVEDDDVEGELKVMAGEQNVPVETMKAYVDKTQNIQTIRNRILHKKIMDFLVHASNINNVGQ